MDGRDFRVFFTYGFVSTGESISAAEAACRRSVAFIAVVGDSCKWFASTPRPGLGEKIADAVMLNDGEGDPKARFSIIGESSGGEDPRGFGEKIADAVISTGDPSAENGRDVRPGDGGRGDVEE